MRSRAPLPLGERTRGDDCGRGLKSTPLNELGRVSHRPPGGCDFSGGSGPSSASGHLLPKGRGEERREGLTP